MLGLINKIAGGIFGVLKVAVILGALLVFFDRINNTATLIKKETISQSILYQPVKKVGAFVFDYVLQKETPEVSEE